MQTTSISEFEVDRSRSISFT